MELQEIKKFIEERGHSVGYVAMQLGYSNTYVSLILCGKTPLTKKFSDRAKEFVERESENKARLRIQKEIKARFISSSQQAREQWKKESMQTNFIPPRPLNDIKIEAKGLIYKLQQLIDKI